MTPWTYGTTFLCLQALTTVLPPPQAPIQIKNSVALARGIHENLDGFFAMTPDAVFFVKAAEGDKSAGENSGESKVTLQFPGEPAPPPFKFFYKSSPQDGGAVTFATANEFDRVVPAKAVPEESVQSILNLAIGKAIGSAKGLIKTRPNELRKAVEVCENANLEFPTPGPKGAESTLQSELEKLKVKVQPSVFSKEYWLRKKDDAG